MHDIQTLVGTKEIKKKLGQQKMPRVKEIFPRAILGYACRSSSALETSEVIKIKFNNHLINKNDDLHHPHQIPENINRLIQQSK
jgi:hypothetical protein